MLFSESDILVYTSINIVYALFKFITTPQVHFESFAFLLAPPTSLNSTRTTFMPVSMHPFFWDASSIAASRCPPRNPVTGYESMYIPVYTSIYKYIPTTYCIYLYIHLLAIKTFFRQGHSFMMFQYHLIHIQCSVLHIIWNKVKKHSIMGVYTNFEKCYFQNRIYLYILV